jgi:hypothetical protein
MNIKQIIREEMDSDWDFVKKADASLKPETHIEFNPPLNLRTEIDKLEKILNHLDSDGWPWCSRRKLTVQNSTSLMGYNYLYGLTLLGSPKHQNETDTKDKCVSFSGADENNDRSESHYKETLDKLGWGGYDTIYGRDLL